MHDSPDGPSDNGRHFGCDDDHADGGPLHEDRCHHASILDLAGECGFGNRCAADARQAWVSRFRSLIWSVLQPLDVSCDLVIKHPSPKYGA